MEHVFPSNKNEPLFRCCSLRQEEPPIFLHFPSPFLDDISATQLQPQHNLFGDPNKPLNITTHDHELNGRSIGTEPTPEIKPKKMKRSSGKKDRHSKIHTAHGLRGRRMRLSIHIARKFFDLQDMLGFDKASRTLDWLFSKSKKAIKELTQTHPSEMGNIQSNSTGERGESTLVEFESGLMENITAKTKARKGSGASIRESLMGAEREPRKSRKYAINPNDPVARESREKARAKARERTIEKMMIKCKEEKSKRSEWLEANPNATNCLEKQSLGFTANPNAANYLDKEGSGFTANPNNTDMNKLGSPKNHFEPPNSHGQDTNFALEHKSSAALGRLEFNTKSLNFLENRGARNSRMNPDSSLAPITPIIEVQNPGCILDLLVTTTNINFHSQHLQERSVQFP